MAERDVMAEERDWYAETDLSDRIAAGGEIVRPTRCARASRCRRSRCECPKTFWKKSPPSHAPRCSDRNADASVGCRTASGGTSPPTVRVR